MSKARGFFDQALALNSENVDALVLMAANDALSVAYTFSDDPVSRLAAAEAALARALSLAPDHAMAHMFLGGVLGCTKRAEQEIAECERALAIDRNLAAAHAIIGARKIYVGRAEETEAHVLEALRLSPRDLSAHYWLMIAGVAKNYLGRYEEAVAWLQRSIEVNRNNPMSHFMLAAALALFGREKEAREAAERALLLNPQATVARLRATAMSFSDDPGFLEGSNRLAEGMRLAGVPEE